MIKLVFKENSIRGDWGDKEFVYAEYKNAEVGDIVAAETRYGNALAKVVAVGVIDERFKEDNLAKVKTVIESATEQRMKQQRIDSQKKLLKKVRRAKILLSLKKLNLTAEDEAIVNDMTDEELETFYEKLTK